MENCTLKRQNKDSNTQATGSRGSDTLEFVYTKTEKSNQAKKTTNPETVIIMDSNGKYLNTRRLFPGKNVTKIHCATIEQTMEVLTNPYFTNPKQIIIHTGTNNIQTEQKGIADKLSQLTDTAQQKFPHSKIILSCLLPRKDISNHIIQNINTELAAKTSSKPNIHLAQHPSITPEHLYDNKHLNKQGVSHLAREFKDIVLNRTHIPTYLEEIPPRHTIQQINVN
uniref:Scavenger receptor cysteine-rich type 1 M130 n=1 Tax=Leptobrachium leishanense TaxID=445787 RepID=A0A8C5MR32_9ANUR